MGKGGGQSATQTQIQDVPEWAKPYYTDILQKAKAASEQPYQAYGQPRLAQPGADITASQEIIRGVAGQPVPGVGEAAGVVGQLGAKARELGGAAPTQFSEFQFDPARQFTGQEVQQYMSPYMQADVEQQKAGAIREFERARAGRSAQAVQAGAFGGSRQGVQEALAGEALGQRLGEIEAGGLQAAFEQASGQFERDRAAQAARETARAEEAARVQAAGAGEALARGQFGLQALGAEADFASLIANLGERARAGDIQAAQLLEAQGLGSMAREQAERDIAYQDFLRQQGYPIEQLGAYSQFIRGLPVSGAGTSTTYQPTPSAGQQALGTGISLLGLYRGLQ